MHANASGCQAGDPIPFSPFYQHQLEQAAMHMAEAATPVDATLARGAFILTKMAALVAVYRTSGGVA
jgi:hypothetical protein